MFILNVIKIFFRNKKKEIKEVIPRWDWIAVLSGGGIVILAIIRLAILCGVVCAFAYGLGYLSVVLGIVTSEVGYIETGIVLMMMVAAGGFVLYLVLIYPAKFVKWIWANIKMAIVEAKELK